MTRPKTNLTKLGYREYMVEDKGGTYYPMPDTLAGYCCVEGNTLYISAIISKQEHRGNFRKFLDDVEQKFDIIKVPSPSLRMYKILKLRGYVSQYEFYEEIGETVRVMVFHRLKQHVEQYFDKKLKEKR